MMRSYWTMVLFFVLFFQTIEISSAICPALCTCHNVSLGVNVDCKSKDLNTIPNDLPYNTISLDLSQNVITNIGESAFSSLNMLTQITLNNNGIKTISPTAFAGLQSLQSLYMVHCGLTTWHEDLLIPVPKLASLYLTDNEFETIPNITSASLRRLFLDKNKFTSLLFPVNFHLNKNLQSVVLSNNNIPQIKDDDLVALKDLPIKSLKLSHCKIETISSKALTHLTELKTLDLNSNGLVSNQLDSLLSQITSNLESLSIDDNQIKNLSINTFAVFANGWLNILNLDGNPLNFIDPQSFAPLTRLTHLSLRNCQLTRIEDALKPLAMLNTLMLSNNPLSEVPNFIPQTLQSLDMSKTMLRVLPSHVLEYADNLQDLIITDSGIETIENEAFTVVESSKTVVDFSDNFFKCDCSLVWFRNWLDVTKVTVKNVGKYLCGSPEPVKGKPLLSFSVANCSLQSTTTFSISPSLTSSIHSPQSTSVTAFEPSSTHSLQPTSVTAIEPSSTHSRQPTRVTAIQSSTILTSTYAHLNKSTLSITMVVIIVIGSAITLAICVLATVLLIRRRNRPSRQNIQSVENDEESLLHM